EYTQPVSSTRHSSGTAFEVATDPVPVAPRRPVPPFVGHLVVRAGEEEIESARRPRCCRQRRLDRAAEVRPALPTGSVPPAVADVVVRAADEDGDPIRRARHGGWGALERAAQILPGVPFGAVPPQVAELP